MVVDRTLWIKELVALDCRGRDGDCSPPPPHRSVRAELSFS